ncbi:MAG: hypothetical protein JWO31_3740 [Phycisphaerales bacterium]|nr:hypothetical protein [Phycisphaerales bacterium]
MRTRHPIVRTDRAPAGRPRGFTLVELLVVIGIIALLISILLPAMSRAREEAKATQCLSNLRQLGMALQSYANDNKDKVPVGYWSGQPWNGYALVAPGYKTYTLMGLLVETGYTRAAPQAYYCPSQTDPRFMFDTPENRWLDPIPAAGAANWMRSGYTVRPSTNWSPYPAVGSVVRFTRIRNRAVAADIIGIPLSSPDYTVAHHRRVNVLYGDRAVRAVDRGQIDAIQKQIQATSSPGISLYIDDSNPTDKNHLWNAFDNY